MSCIVNVSTNSNNIIDVSVNNSSLNVNIGKYAIIFEDAEEYDGEYVVIPKAGIDVELNTSKKFLKNNIIVKEIPYYETSNSAGGDTVYIGSEVMINGEQ